MSEPRDGTWVSYIAGISFTIWDMYYLHFNIIDLQLAITHKIMIWSHRDYTGLSVQFSHSVMFYSLWPFATLCKVVSSAYLRLLIFLPAILIPACASSSPAFLVMYSAYKLNKQGDNIQPWHTPFPIWNQSVVPCPVLTVASWTAYRFLKRQVRWSGIPISFRIFHSLLWSTQSKPLA